MPTLCEYVTLHGEGGIADVIKVTVIEIKRLSWIIQMCPIWSHEFLRVENLFCLATVAKEMQREKDLPCCFWLWRWRKETWTKGSGSLKI